eukprot:scaffold22736_cov15-Tisochrysis_lutea.AAC.1
MSSYQMLFRTASVLLVSCPQLGAWCVVLAFVLHGAWCIVLAFVLHGAWCVALAFVLHGAWYIVMAAWSLVRCSGFVLHGATNVNC